MIYFGVMRGDYKTTTTFSGDAGPKLCPPKLLYIFFFRMSCHRIPNASWCDLLGIHWDTPPKLNSSGPEKLPKPKRRGSSSNHSFFSGRAVKLGGCTISEGQENLTENSDGLDLISKPKVRGILWLWPFPGCQWQIKVYRDSLLKME